MDESPLPKLFLLASALMHAAFVSVVGFIVSFFISMAIFVLQGGQFGVTYTLTGWQAALQILMWTISFLLGIYHFIKDVKNDYEALKSPEGIFKLFPSLNHFKGN